MLDELNRFLTGPTPRRLLFFDEMLTPTLIRSLYWLGLLAVVWTGLGHFFTNGFFGIFEAIVYVVIGTLTLRVVAELIMVLFKINDNIEKTVQNTALARTPIDKRANDGGKLRASKASGPRRKKKKVSKKVSKKHEDNEI